MLFINLWSSKQLQCIEYADIYIYDSYIVFTCLRVYFVIIAIVSFWYKVYAMFDKNEYYKLNITCFNDI